MQYTFLQEKKIPAVALGTWSWGYGGVAGGDAIFGNQYGKAELQPVFERAMSKGLVLWDTASVYASGASETLLGEFVQGYDDAIISTKFTPYLAENRGENAMGELLEESKHRLHRDYIDIYWIHNTQDVPKWTEKLIELLKEGRIEKVGVSNHNLEQIKYVQQALQEAGFALHAIQNHYSLLYPTIEESGILAYCQANDITVFSYMVLEQGALTGKYTVNNPLPVNSRRGQAFPPETLGKLEPLFAYMQELAQKYDVSVAQIPVAWAIAKRTVPIIGVTKVEQVDDVYQAASVQLSQEEVLILDNVAKQTRVSVKGNWEQSM